MSNGTVNKVILLGRLGADPEVRGGASGVAIVNIVLATNDNYKDKNTGQNIENTEWHRVTFFGKPAETITKYSVKGDLLYVEGKIKTDKYKDKDGIEKYATKVIGSQFQFVGGGSKKDNEDPNAYAKAKGKDVANNLDNFSDDDIPF